MPAALKPFALKRRLRATADHAALWSGVLARRERAHADALTVLTYHRVLPAERCERYPFASLAMPVDAFRAQVRWLARRGEVLPLGEALDRLASRRDRARPLYALTFDDGYDDSHEHAASVLEDEGVRGTFFVATGFVGARELLWFDRAALLFGATTPERRAAIARAIAPHACWPVPHASPAEWTRASKHVTLAERRALLAELEREAGGAPPVDGHEALSVRELVELHARGHEIGSHSVTHPLLPELDDADLAREVDGSRATIERWLGAAPAGFCYPNGSGGEGDARVAAAVARAGHAYACTTRDGVHRADGDALAIPRVDVVHERASGADRSFDSTAFRRELCGLYRRRPAAVRA